MKTNPLFLMFVAMATWCNAQSGLVVEVELNRPDAGGILRVAFCPDADSYANDKGCRLVNAPARGAMVRIAVEDMEPGTYAIKAFHDVNGDGRLDTNVMGLPKEPYGFGNDAMGMFGPPSFQQASFKATGRSQVLRFRMKGG